MTETQLRCYWAASRAVVKVLFFLPASTCSAGLGRSTVLVQAVVSPGSGSLEESALPDFHTSSWSRRNAEFWSHIPPAGSFVKISRLVTLLVLTRLRGRASVASCFYRQALLRTNILTDNRVQTRHINVQTYWWTFTSKHITSHHITSRHAMLNIECTQ